MSLDVEGGLPHIVANMDYFRVHTDVVMSLVKRYTATATASPIDIAKYPAY